MSCVHTRVGRARPYRPHPWREVIRDNCPCFSVSFPSSASVARVLLLFGCHAAVHDSPLPPLRRAQEPSAKSHVLSITSTRNTSRCSSQRLVLTFSRSSSENHLRVSMGESPQFRNSPNAKFASFPRLIVPGKSLRRVALKCNHERAVCVSEITKLILSRCKKFFDLRIKQNISFFKNKNKNTQIYFY